MSAQRGESKIVSREVTLPSGHKVWVKYPPLSFDEMINVARDVAFKTLVNPQEVYTLRNSDLLPLFALIFKLEESYALTFVPEAP